MKPPFFITGLPRSRTSWLANLFTTSDQMCYHDLLDQVDSLAEFLAKLAGGNGDSDSGLVFLYPKLAEMFPESRWLLVLREPADCLHSLQAAAAGNQWQESVASVTENWPALQAIYQRNVNMMLDHPNVHMMEFEALDDFELVATAGRFLCPEMKLTRARFDLLDSLKIEPIPAKCPKSIDRIPLDAELKGLLSV